MCYVNIRCSLSISGVVSCARDHVGCDTRSMEGTGKGGKRTIITQHTDDYKVGPYCYT